LRQKFRSDKTYPAIASYCDNHLFVVLFYLFCSIACFQPADLRVESELLENFQDINFEDPEQQQAGFEGKCP
jgi:hypothetical protein